MNQPFKDFDFTNFWDENDYALEEYVGEKPTDEYIGSIEQEIGYKLPASYIELVNKHNGGIPVNTCFPMQERTGWAKDHVAITGIFGIDRNKKYSLCGSLGSSFMIEEWGYPEIGICICDTPSAGHDMIMLDYSNCGKEREPEVMHVNQEGDYEKTFVAKDFETFIRGLVSADVYDTSAEDLKNSLEKIRTGEFSPILNEFFKKENDIDFNKAFRNLLTELANSKGCFALHADELSHLAYDAQFYLLSKNKKVKTKEDFLKDYPEMIAGTDADISTGGYAPGFVEDWLNERIANKQVSKKLLSGYAFSKEYEQKVLEQVKKYEKAG